VCLRSDAPLPQPPHLAAPTFAHWQRLRQLLEALEFNSLLQRLDKLAVSGGAGTEVA
jgi:hypothetical protein